MNAISSLCIFAEGLLTGLNEYKELRSNFSAYLRLLLQKVSDVWVM
jgi:hypothetical protein